MEQVKEFDHDLLIKMSVQLETLIDGQEGMCSRIKWLERVLYPLLGIGGAAGASVGVAKAAMIVLK